MKRLRGLKRRVKYFLKRYRWGVWLLAQLRYPVYRNNKKLCSAVETFAASEVIKDKRALTRLQKKMYMNRLMYRISYDEYFLFGFEYLNDAGKRSFVGDKERVELCDSLNTPETKKLFNDKYETYLRFQPYYHREIIRVCSEDDKEEFDRFVSSHPDIILKPVSKSFGKGVCRVRTAEEGFQADKLFVQLRENGDCILEETIVQAQSMAAFHPESVNTVRLATFFEDDTVTCLFSFFRMGCGSAVVDNAGAGGIFATVDVATGVVKTAGIQKNGTEFLFHPDTGKQIIGWQVPRWQELLDVAEKLARMVPEQKYVSWDMALTEDGWVIVEGNCRGQLVQQYADHKGCRDLISRTLAKARK